MGTRRRLMILATLSCIAMLTGCASTMTPEQILSKIIFQNKYVGDIDKIAFNEPSGIIFHRQRGTLFAIGDEGDICELALDGKLIKQKHLCDADFEGITYNPSTGMLYLAIEGEEAVLEVDPETFKMGRRFNIPRTFHGKTMLAKGGQGLEAIMFIPDPANPQGGLFYVANQAFTLDDANDVSAVFTVELPIKTEGQPVITGYFCPGIIDLSGLHYDSANDHILLISDSTNTLLEYSRKYELLAVYAFPGDNQEGITLDDDGYIYIAQDSGGILKLKWLR